MISEFADAAKAYLDEAQPKDGGWTYSDADRWGKTSQEREAKAFRAAMQALNIN